MYKKLLLILYLFIINLNADSLKDHIKEVIQTNPNIKQMLHNYRITKEDLNIAESEYYPTLDFKAAVSQNGAGKIFDDVEEVDYTFTESSLTLTQNLFNGFGTTKKVNYQERRLVAAAYKYLETVNDIVFKLSTSYVEVLKAHQLLQTARENVKVNYDIYSKVKDLFDGGMITESEVKKIEASLSLAKSNLIVQTNNTLDKEYSYKRLLGRMPQIKNMETPELNFKLPNSIERATLYAVKYNPSVIVTKYNIEASQQLWEQTKKDYYPKIDFILQQTYNTVDPEDNGYESKDDRYSAKLQLTYNLYNGGATKAKVQQKISELNQEVEKQRDIRRQTIEGLELSWNAYKMIDFRLEDLKNYSWLNQSTLKLYQDEYELGQRTLIELLTAHNEAINSKSKVIESKYDALIAKFRVFDAMGLLLKAIYGDTDQFTSIVNISNKPIKQNNIKDKVVIKLDKDNDKIVDNLDICDNSKIDNNIMPYGCVKIVRDYDKDGVEDMLDSCPMTEEGVEVNGDGCKRIQKENVELLDEESLQIPGIDTNYDDGSIEKVTLDQENGN